MKNDKVDDVCEKIQHFLEGSPVDDIKKNLKAILVNNLSNLDLISREEFDIQKSVLNKTRAKLIELEARMEELIKKQESGAD